MRSARSALIGTVTFYRGRERPNLQGVKLNIVAVVVRLGQLGDLQLVDDDLIEAVGGVKQFDRIKVRPWLEEEGRFSVATCDLRALDLEAFEYLRKYLN